MHKLINSTHSKLVAFVVVQIERAEKLAASSHLQLGHLAHARRFGERLPRELFHLNVVKLAEVAEPFDQLRSGRSCELNNF